MLNSIQNKFLVKSDAYINGEWIESSKKFAVVNPFNQETMANVADLTADHTRKAIESASKAFNSWSAMTAGERSDILMKWYYLQMENKQDLAHILTCEQGKPIQEAAGEIEYGASFVQWYAEEAKRAYGDVIPPHKSDSRITVIKQAVGVVGAITPWNFPNAMITRKVAPALAAGCTVVLKPSALTPLSALALASLAEEAGMPAGVFNVVTSSNSSEIGLELTSNPLVKKISFTGSTKVGKQLIKQSADTVKKVSMELGGNAPFIVFKDADIDAAVEGAIDSKFRNAGQTCVCANRIFAEDEIYDEFTKKLTEAVKLLQVGNGLERETQIGPLVNEEALSFVKEMVRDAVDKNGEVLSGGKSIKDHELIFEPTVIGNASDNMKLFSEEIFGPVAPVFRFKSEDEVIKLANDTEYGLASYFYGRDYAKIWRVAEALEYGIVGINTGLISTAVAPFGGVKESGFGREGSKYGMDEYLNVKYMCWGRIDS